ncbi:MAG TPA: AI-2E family transporter [Terracidiphilus sp.]|jgi:predicted PurR-regulated permease PerM|nr:AI-2E family transporter [Terracidiphilus sp.]
MTESSSRSHDHRGDILFVFAVAAAGYVAWLVRDVLILLYVSALFAVVFTPIVRATGRLRVGRWQPLKGKAVLFLLLAVLGAFTAFGYFTIPPVLHDLDQLSRQAPAKVPEWMGKLQRVPFIDRLDDDEVVDKLQGYAGQAATYTLLSVKNWAGKLADVISGVVLMLYFILEGDQAYHWFLSFFPQPRRARLRSTLDRAAVRMGKWLLGQASLMLILGTASTITFVLLHLRYAYALGVLTGLLNIVPVLGVTVSLVLAASVALIDSWQHALGVVIFFGVYLQVENSYLIPRIMKSRVDLPALAVLVSLLLGFSLAGIVGGLVSVPTAVLVAVLIEEYLVQKDA